MPVKVKHSPPFFRVQGAIDGSGRRGFRRQLGSYLRKRINDTKGDARFIGKIKIQDSKGNNLLQLADLICGAVARSYSQKDDAETVGESGCYPILNHTVFKYAGSARLMGKSGGCGT